MKYVIIQGDGMGDWQGPNGEPTPLEAARTPNMDLMANAGVFGRIHTIPQGLPPGSDVGNLSLFGYDPNIYYTGRAPLEAAAMGVELQPNDQAFRLNMVCLAGKGEEAVMADYSGNHIDSEAASQLLQSLARDVERDGFGLHAGVSYRHLLVWRDAPRGLTLTPPHDISDKQIAPHLPKGEGAERLLHLMATAEEVFAEHPANKARLAAGKAAITCVWPWGQGAAVSTPLFKQLHGLTGSCISAVDLVRGVATCAGFRLINAPGATGYLDTDYASKARCAVEALGEDDLVFVHIEAPDEAGHMGNRAEKIKAIEQIDEKVVGYLLQHLPKPYTMLLTSDHATPVVTKTHSMDPPPFALVSSQQVGNAAQASTRYKYGETDASSTAVVIKQGHSVIKRLLTHVA